MIAWYEAALRLGGAAVIGAALGLDRELRGKSAGIQTNALVCLGAALLTLGAVDMTPADPPQVRADAVSRTVQGIVTGIGFLGGGVIIRDAASMHVRGLTTAATIWLSTVLGVLCGVGSWTGGLMGLGFAFVVLIVGRRLDGLVAARLPALTGADAAGRGDAAGRPPSRESCSRRAGGAPPSTPNSGGRAAPTRDRRRRRGSRWRRGG